MGKFSFFYSILLFCVVGSLDAHAVSDPCRDESVKSVEIWIDPKKPELGKFTYRYQVHNWGARSQYPVVVVIPGGPGVGIIGDWGSPDQIASDWGLPKQYPYLFLDPRGVNCNRDYDRRIPANTYVTKQLAVDVLEVLKSENIKNYVFNAGSYGTAWATILYEVIEKSKFPLPRFMVLNGTLGRAWPVGRGQTVDYSLIWEVRKSELSEKIRKKLEADLPPLGIASERWGKFIHDRLGYRGPSYNPLIDSLVLLESDDPAQLQKLKDKVLSSTHSPQPSPDISDLIQEKMILCRELRAEYQIPMKLVRGRLLPISKISDYCKGIDFDRPFDSRQVQIRIPILYVEGKLDPMTPTWQSGYHFRWQNESTRRVYIQTLEGAHGGLFTHLNDCAGTLWNALFSDSKWAGLHEALQSCRMKTRVFERK